jgi:hypothetical protein
VTSHASIPLGNNTRQTGADVWCLSYASVVLPKGPISNGYVTGCDCVIVLTVAWDTGLQRPYGYRSVKPLTYVLEDVKALPSVGFLLRTLETPEQTWQIPLTRNAVDMNLLPNCRAIEFSILLGSLHA